MAIIAILSSFIFMDVFRSKGNVALITTMDVLVTDLKKQQLKAMTGNTEGRITNDAYGVYFETNKYILFHGLTYDSSDISNFPVDLTDGDQFDLPNSLPQLIFTPVSGEIQSFDPDKNLVIKNTNTGSKKTIIFNKFGVIANILTNQP